MRSEPAVAVVVGLMLTACATVPSGPSVMVLPGTNKSFEQFQEDDSVCRQWAAGQIGITPGRASAGTLTTGAAIGTGVGAAAGAALGAAAGSPATGAAVGAGVGLLGGTTAGASRAEGTGEAAQERYDVTYMQCMYAKGHRIPVPHGAGSYTSPEPAAAPPLPPGIPPPPAGAPPPPPPGSSR